MGIVKKYIFNTDIGLDQEKLKEFILRDLKSETESYEVRILKRSIDARKSEIKINIEAEVITKGEALYPKGKYIYHDVSKKMPVLIVGCGPAGMFAALRLIELGYRPIIIERGKKVQARRRDLAAINKENIVSENSNYCFGEGGAGTYSDGKLYTRSGKRGDINRILEIFYQHGADEAILYEAHPHIGTNKLPKIISAINETIIDSGGEIHFNERVNDFILKGSEILGVITSSGKELLGEGVILATGHSARDIFILLQEKKIEIEAKQFALGVRIEHPQELIDRIQYHGRSERGLLPAASYSLVSQFKYRGESKGVFSFCMCPGGFIVPSATSQEEIVLNGMSPSKRNSYFANSGIVVSINEKDWKKYSKEKNELAGVAFQKEIEKKSWIAGGKTQQAPALRLTDFLKNKLSSSLPVTSYMPGLTSADLGEVFPSYLRAALQSGLIEFGKKLKGLITDDAIVAAVESRTSSPVRIPRNRETYEHIRIKRFYPCGEGAGYAGGIISAAMDGEKCAEKWVQKYGKPD